MRIDSLHLIECLEEQARGQITEDQCTSRLYDLVLIPRFESMFQSTARIEIGRVIFKGLILLEKAVVKVVQALWVCIIGILKFLLQGLDTGILLHDVGLPVLKMPVQVVQRRGQQAEEYYDKCSHRQFMVIIARYARPQGGGQCRTLPLLKR